jgi:TonB family protein
VIRVALLALSLFSFGAQAQLEAQPTDFEKEEADKEPPKPPELTKPPELLEGVEPEYPPAAMEEGREGVVTMLIEIDAAGGVTRVQILESAGEDLDHAALHAASQLKFSPAEWDGVPGPIAIQYQQVFQLDQVVEEVDVAEETPPEGFEDFEDFEDPDPAASDDAPVGPLNFAGVVREAGTNTPIEGVEVTLELPNADRPDDPIFRVTSTDEKGRFVMRGVPAGNHQVSFAMTSYQPAFTDEDFEEKKRTEVIIYLRPESANALETVISARRAQKEVSKISLTRQEVKKIPGTFGDPLRVIENLPGLARAPFAGGSLIVRGANPEDSGVYYDGVEIPILYHFGGLKSVVNAEFLEDINFYPGGFGARYGRATAGVVDVTSRSLKMNRFHGATDVSVLDSGFFVGGPLELHESLPKVVVAAAARRSYIDAILPFVLEAFGATGFVVAPIYWDYQLKAQVQPWDDHTFSVFAFGSSDDLKVLGGNNDAEFQLGVLQRWHRVVGKWRWELPGDLVHTLQPYVGFNETNIGAERSDVDVELGGTIGAYHWGLRDELRWTPSDEVSLLAGLDIAGNTNDLEFSFPTLGASEVLGFPRVYNRFEIGDPQTIERGSYTNGLGGFVETSVKPLPWLQLTGGLRLDMYQFVWEDPDNKPSIPSNPFADPLDDAYQWTADPRLTVRVDPFNGLVFKGAAGVYHQPPSTGDLDPDNGNPDLGQPRAVQLIGGFEHNLNRSIYIDVQGYVTARDQLIQDYPFAFGPGGGGGGGPPDPDNPVGGGGDDDEDDEDPLSDNGGVGSTVGVEILLRHNPGKYSIRWIDDLWREALPGLHADWMTPLLSDVTAFGWIAYTLSRTVVDVDPESDIEELSSFDQTHILTVVGQLTLPLEVSLGARFRLVSGNPTTVPVGSVQDLDTNNYSPISSPIGGRLPTFHQLDIRIDRKFVFDNFSLTPYLDLLNIYNATNAETYITDYRSVQQEPLPGLTFIPNLGLQGEF